MIAHHVSRALGITVLDWRGNWLRGLGRASHGAGTYLCTAPRAVDYYRAQVGQGARVYAVHADTAGFMDCVSPIESVTQPSLTPWTQKMRTVESDRHPMQPQFAAALRRTQASVDGLVRLMLREMGAVECSKALLRAGIPGLLYRVGDGSTLSHPNMVVFDDDRLTVQGEEIE